MIINKEAKRDFEIKSSIVAGIALTGAEVKSLREGRGSMKGSHIKIVGDELFLLGLEIPKYSHYSGVEYDSKRVRKLLVKRKEIEKLREQMEGKALAIIPTKLFFGGRWVKVEVSMGRGRKEYEKREIIKKRDVDREIARAIKTKNR